MLFGNQPARSSPARAMKSQIIDKGLVADGRWFDNSDAATAFAIQCAGQSGTAAIEASAASIRSFEHR